MKIHTKIMRTIVPLAVAGLLAVGPAVAGKPSWAGKGKKVDERSGLVEVSYSGHFGKREREVVRNYIDAQYARGHCPPGLAKKHNGCMPPGHAKRWHMGQPLPGDVIVYDLSPRLTIDLGAPPRGHRYVRVASDILMIAVGTGLVVDALSDLSEL